MNEKSTHPFLPDDDRIYQRFIELLDQNFIDYAYADQLADTLHISQRKLNSIVKQRTGKTACRMAEEKMVGEAKKQLAETSQKIKEIAAALGFEDHFYFYRMFKKLNGLSPGKYRKSLFITK